MTTAETTAMESPEARLLLGVCRSGSADGLPAALRQIADSYHELAGPETPHHTLISTFLHALAAAEDGRAAGDSPTDATAPTLGEPLRDLVCDVRRARADDHAAISNIYVTWATTLVRAYRVAQPPRSRPRRGGLRPAQPRTAAQRQHRCVCRRPLDRHQQHAPAAST